MAKTSYQGTIGAYSERACEILAPEHEAIGYQTFDQTFEALINRETDLAVIPVENSIGGPVERVFKDWLRKSNLWVSGEHYLPVELCLVATHNDVSKIKKVYSHEHAIKQCHGFLNKYGMESDAKYGDTAASASAIADMMDPSCAAIASHAAAQEYGLRVIESNIQDYKNNYTRFWLYSTVGSVPLPEKGKKFKTSFIFKLKHAPGTLYEALGGFADMGINLTKIESFFDPHTQTTPEFWIDSEEHLNNENFRKALEKLREFSEEDTVQILGCYECTKPDVPNAPERSLAQIAQSIRNTQCDFHEAAIINPKISDPSKYYRTRLLFNTPHTAGSLAKALSCFKPNGVELTLIESFTGPDFRIPHFLVEFEGHKDDINCHNALNDIAQAIESKDHMKVVDVRETIDPHQLITPTPSVSTIRGALTR